MLFRKKHNKIKDPRDLRSNMSKNVIGALVSLLLLFGLIVCLIGRRSIISAFQTEYSTVTYHMADSAAIIVKGDHIDQYLAGEEKEEYSATQEMLDQICQRLNVSLIYVIKVDQSDYGRFVSVFNSVNNSVDNTDYTQWELGHERDTTNDEYKENYRALYEQKKEYGTIFRLHPPADQHPHITTLVPIKNSKGEVTALLCIQRPIREMSDAFKPYLLQILTGVFVMVVLVSFLAAAFLKKRIITPVERVSEEATRFANEKAQGKPIGDISKYEVIQNLASSIDSMETDMVNYIENLTSITAEKERINAELSIASSIQKDSLPDVFPAFPDRHEFDIYASMDPAKMIGGDFYNFFLLDDDHLAMVMADVSGKGIPAALLMMVTNILIRERAEMGGTPAEVLSFVNNNLCARNRTEMFVTVWLGILEISTGRLISANAGHEDPAVYHKNGEFEIVKEKHGFVLGGYEDMPYQVREQKLGKGDKLFLYTDGVPEATDCENNMFGLNRMLDALNEYKDGSPQDILDGIRKSVNDFVGSAPQFDDLTMLCFELKEEKETVL